jgi:hypothetical protein
MFFSIRIPLALRCAALGQLPQKELHFQGESSFLQISDYPYNIRGWLEQIKATVPG